MYLCTSGSNRDTISYFPIYMKHFTVSQPNIDNHTLEFALAVVSIYLYKAVHMFVCDFFSTRYLTQYLSSGTR